MCGISSSCGVVTKTIRSGRGGGRCGSPSNTREGMLYLIPEEARDVEYSSAKRMDEYPPNYSTQRNPYNDEERAIILKAIELLKSRL